MSKALIIGGGAAGMFAGITAALNGHEVHIYEKNDKLGKKLFLTGKGRCNLTNACDTEELLASVTSNSKFLYSSLYGCTSGDVMAFFEKLGLPLKTERGGRVFPVSDHSSDVIRTMERELDRLGVQVHLRTEVKAVQAENRRFAGILLADKRKVTGDACIVATGGLSYQTTGSTGDGYTFARELGHAVTACIPSLVPIETRERWAADLQGLSLKNVTFSVYDGKKRLYRDFGEMLFTHYGVSGPLVLSASSYIGKTLLQKELKAEIDLKPALSAEQLDQRVQREFEENRNRQFKNSVGKLFPSKLIPVMIALSGIDPEKKVNTISREERSGFVTQIKHFPLTLAGLRGFNEAIITKGGVKTKEIDPGTMESKLIRGVYFIGEVLDVDALTGGYNLQLAWATAYAAGCSIPDTNTEESAEFQSQPQYEQVNPTHY